MTWAEPSNITGINGLMTYADTVSNGLFFTMLPISLWLVVFLFLKLKTFYSADAAMAAGFITVGVSFFLYLLGGLSSSQLFWTVAMVIFSAIWAYWWKSKE